MSICQNIYWGVSTNKELVTNILSENFLFKILNCFRINQVRVHVLEHSTCTCTILYFSHLWFSLIFKAPVLGLELADEEERPLCLITNKHHISINWVKCRSLKASTMLSVQSSFAKKCIKWRWYKHKKHNIFLHKYQYLIYKNQIYSVLNFNIHTDKR